MWSLRLWRVLRRPDNASDDDDFVAKDSARALQSLFRSSDGYDEELARVQRGETEDGGDLYD